MSYPTPPSSIIKFSKMFPDERTCANYLFQMRWPKGYECPKCGTRKAGPIVNTPGMMECENHHKISVKAGTALHRSKQGLETWFHAAWLMATLKPGISAVQFQRQLGLSRLETAWTLLHKIRSAMVAPTRDKLTSKCDDPDHTDHWIEIDHIEIGGEQGAEDRKRHGSNKAIVAIAVEVHSWEGLPVDEDGEPRKKGKKGRYTKAGRCRLRVVSDHGAKEMREFLRDNCERDSRIISDAHQSLKFIGLAGMRRHTTVNAAIAVDPLPTVGRVTTNLKRWLLGTHKGAVENQHMQAYLNEFVFRFNRRDIPWIAFNRVLALCALPREALEYEGLYKHTWVHPNPSEPPLQRGLPIW